MEYTNEYDVGAARLAKIRQTLEHIKQQLPLGCTVELRFSAASQPQFEVKDTISRRSLAVLTPEILGENKVIPHDHLVNIQKAKSKIDYSAYSLPSQTLKPKVTAESIEQQNHARLALQGFQERQRAAMDRQQALRAEMTPKMQAKKQPEPSSERAQSNNKEAKDYHAEEYTPRPSPFKRGGSPFG